MQLTEYLFFHVVSACAQVLTNKVLSDTCSRTRSCGKITTMFD